jgi:hypothetical protein
MATMVVAALGLSACEDDDKVDTVPPAVTISSVSHTAEALTVRVRADDYISVAFIVTQVCCDDLGKAIADTVYFTGRTTSATATTTFAFWEPITQNTAVEITGIGVDSQGNQAQRVVPYLITVP